MDKEFDEIENVYQDEDKDSYLVLENSDLKQYETDEYEYEYEVAEYDKSEDEEEYIITTTDPFERPVKVKKMTWENHVTDGDHDRTEFLGQEWLIENVIRNPSIIIRDNPDDPENKRERYLDLVVLPEASTVREIVIVVDHSYKQREFGDVVTIISKKKLNQERLKGGAIYVRHQPPTTKKDKG